MSSLQNRILKHQKNCLIKKSQKSPIDVLKDYLPIIIVVFPIFGAIWQIVELSNMSIPYVRFFSVTQLVADSILLLMVIVPWIIGFIVFKEFYTLIKNEHNSTKRATNKYLSIVWIIIITLVLFIIWKLFLKTYDDLYNFIGYYLLVFYIYVTFLGLLLSSIMEKVFTKFINLIIEMHNESPISTTISLFLGFFILFHFTFYIPKNLKNIEYLQEKTGKKLSEQDIMYFNDKYIFVRQDDKKILVVKFDDLFKKDKK